MSENRRRRRRRCSPHPLRRPCRCFVFMCSLPYALPRTEHQVRRDGERSMNGRRCGDIGLSWPAPACRSHRIAAPRHHAPPRSLLLSKCVSTRVCAWDPDLVVAAESWCARSHRTNVKTRWQQMAVHTVFAKWPAKSLRSSKSHVKLRQLLVQRVVASG